MKHPLPQRLLHTLAPGLLVLVACAQLTLVRTHHLTPWKGGGFGMFSTFDSPSARTLRLVLLTPEGEVGIAIPTLHVPQKRLLNLPNTALLTDLAEQTARGSWLVYTPEQLAAARRVLPAEIRRQFARNGPSPEPAAFPQARFLAGLEGARPEILGVRAEVWRLLYDADASQLRPELVNTATVDAP